MKRRLSREIALQSLYQIQIARVSTQEAIDVTFEEAQQDNEANLDIVNEEMSTDYCIELVEGVRNHITMIDQWIVEYLKGWKIDRLSRIDKDILRLASYEMIYRDDVPPKAVINEALELAKKYSTDDSSKFVNGVLGQMIQHIDTLKQKSISKS
jgi:N utilization substance protein B